jgi:hypothetical protein
MMEEECVTVLMFGNMEKENTVQWKGTKEFIHPVLIREVAPLTRKFFEIYYG